MISDKTFERLKFNVIDAGLCTHCGTCAGLSDGALRMRQTAQGLLPTFKENTYPHLSQIAYDACPGKGIDYPALNQQVFGKLPENWLMGINRSFWIGHSQNPEIRHGAASGGIITSVLTYLLETERIDAAVVLRQGFPKPWKTMPILARTRDEIIAAQQSVYTPTSVNTIMAKMSRFDGRLAYVGLPDQVAALRALQQFGHEGAKKVEYVIGPYMGTGLYLGAVQSYLKANGISDLSEISEIRYRDGTWPGYLRITLKSGRELKVEKFYYNYLIPFYITRASLLSVDFTNELTDISVGDAWRPDLVEQGNGFSVVIARSQKGEELLNKMQVEGFIHLEKISMEDAMGMHGHMLDFKKRGSFIRLTWREMLGKQVPSYGYKPTSISFQRQLVEVVISFLFAFGRTKFGRSFVEHIPLRILGPTFNTLRKMWKYVSKPTKRKGLKNLRFEVVHD
jgi:coenzyme F420 hydrogenase subunit beta